MGSAIRKVSSIRTNVNSMSNSEVQETDIHVLIKDMHNNQTNMERQLLIITKALASLAGNASKPTNGTSSQASYRCWFHESNTHDTQDCYHFKSLRDEDKLEMLRKKGLCYCCISGQHLAKDCTRRGL